MKKKLYLQHARRIYIPKKKCVCPVKKSTAVRVRIKRLNLSFTTYCYFFLTVVDFLYNIRIFENEYS